MRAIFGILNRLVRISFTRRQSRSLKACGACLRISAGIPSIPNAFRFAMRCRNRVKALKVTVLRRVSCAGMVR